MTEPLTITMSDSLREEVERIAEANSQSLESVVLERLQYRILPDDIQSELDALQYLSDDALWTIAREQMPQDKQTRADELMSRNNFGTITDEEYAELEQYVERGDRLMLRKAEVAVLLKKRGFPFTQADFKAHV
jgi:hypothetical protein